MTSNRENYIVLVWVARIIGINKKKKKVKSNQDTDQHNEDQGGKGHLTVNNIGTQSFVTSLSYLLF